jgi:hypothetical protein
MSPARAIDPHPAPDFARIFAKSDFAAEGGSLIDCQHGPVPDHLVGEFGFEATAVEEEVNSTKKSTRADLLQSGCTQNRLNCRRDELVIRDFLFELLFAVARQFVKTHAAAGFGTAPFRLRPSLHQKPLKRWIKGALLRLEHLIRNLADTLRDGVTVHGAGLEDAQDQHRQRAFRYRISRHSYQMYTSPIQNVKRARPTARTEAQTMNAIANIIGRLEAQKATSDLASVEALQDFANMGSITPTRPAGKPEPGRKGGITPEGHWRPVLAMKRR